jgi:hypothetical protein
MVSARAADSNESKVVPNRLLFRLSNLPDSRDLRDSAGSFLQKVMITNEKVLFDRL